MNEVVERRDVGGVATLTLNRPEALNALSPQLFIELRAHVDAIAADTEGVGCVVLCGAGRTGSVSAIDTRAIGVTVIALGGGRTRAADPIDHAVGLSDLVPLGTAVENDSPLAVVHARDEESFQQASGMIRDAYQLDGKPHEPAAIIERVS